MGPQSICHGSVAANCRVLSMHYPLKAFHLWLRPVVRPEVCLQSVHCVCSNPKLQGFLLCPAPLTFLVVGRAGNQISCLPPTSVEAAVELVNVVIFPSPMAKVIWSGVGLSLGCFQNEISQEPQWTDSCRVSVGVGWGKSVEHREGY